MVRTCVIIHYMLNYVCLGAAMTQARQTTESRRSVIVQKNRICNHGRVRYQLTNANGEYALTHDFKNAIRQLPMSYSVSEYTQFLDDWGTVSDLIYMIACKFKISPFHSM